MAVEVSEERRRLLDGRSACLGDSDLEVALFSSGFVREDFRLGGVACLWVLD